MTLVNHDTIIAADKATEGDRAACRQSLIDLMRESM